MHGHDLVTGEHLAFGEVLKRYRVVAGLTQEELAERAHLSVRAISDLERGARRTPYRETVRLLVVALELSAQDADVFGAAARRRTSPSAAVPPSLSSAAQGSGAEVAGTARGALDGGVHTLTLTAFVGREREVELVRQRLLQPETCLLTLVGPGGTGKTRLALQVAEAMGATFPDGVSCVSLAALADASMILPTIALALGVTEAAGQALLARLSAFLRHSRTLLVLDNFEQIVSAAPTLTELLAACRHLKLLVTSRMPLHVHGERIFEVPPLSVPDPTHLPPLEELSRYEAVRLFVARAQDVQPDFALTSETALPVAEVCARLDGLPLALELAAARVRFLPPQALLSRLGSRLKLLTGGERDRPARQQTLRSALDWSYDLLDAGEQTLFARLAVFVGGCTLEAAAAVCNAPGDLPFDVLEGIASLLDKSLLRRAEGVAGEPRFVMLETIREYALERLAVSGEDVAINRQHAAYYLRLAEAAAPRLRGAEQTVWLNRLDAEHDNLHAALQWWLGGGDADVGARLAAALGCMWYVRGYLSEGRRWLASALERGCMAPRPARATVLYWAGVLAWWQSDLQQAVTLCEESRALFQAMGDKQGTASALRVLGNVALDQADYGRAATLIEESLALFQEVGDNVGSASALHNLGDTATRRGDYGRAAALLAEALALFQRLGDTEGIAYTLGDWGTLAWRQGDYSRAEALYTESLAQHRAVGNKWGIAALQARMGWMAHVRGDDAQATKLYEQALALYRDLGNKAGLAYTLNGLGMVVYGQGDDAWASSCLEEALPLYRDVGNKAGIALSLHNLGCVARSQGDSAQATAYITESLALRRELEDKRGIAEALHALGCVSLDQGDDGRAAALLGESLALFQDLGDKQNIALALVQLGYLAHRRGAHGRAVHLCAAAAALRDALGAPLTPIERTTFERIVAAARAGLDEQMWTAAWANGWAMALEQAIAEALEEIRQHPPGL